MHCRLFVLCPLNASGLMGRRRLLTCGRGGSKLTHGNQLPHRPRVEGRSVSAGEQEDATWARRNRHGTSGGANGKSWT